MAWLIFILIIGICYIGYCFSCIFFALETTTREIDALQARVDNLYKIEKNNMGLFNDYEKLIFLIAKEVGIKIDD